MQLYDNNADCSWLIQCTNGGTPEVDITAMDTEANFDFVSVLDGPGQNDPQLLQASGGDVSSLPATRFQASGNELLVQLPLMAGVCGRRYECVTPCIIN